ncbi:MAG: PAC2 family protein, partial [Chloroflexi bacterium]|nr:PAC2 family protein [Chloroflexota bacterium]
GTLHELQAHYAEGYAIPYAAAVEAIRLLARTEGVILDPVYTAKAFCALLDGVPHTRPARVTTSASSTNLGGDFSDIRWGPSRYEGPTGITSILTDSLTRHGIECVALWGHAPHYLQVRPNPVVTLALIQAAQRFIPQMIDVERLEKRAKEFDSTVARALEDQDQVRGYVSQLEQKYDSDTEAEEEDAAIPEDDAESLVADVEEFLRRSSDRPDDGDPPVG